MGVRRARSPFAPLLSADVVPVHLLQAGLGRDPLSSATGTCLAWLGPNIHPLQIFSFSSNRVASLKTGPATHLGVRVRVMRNYQCTPVVEFTDGRLLVIQLEVVLTWCKIFSHLVIKILPIN